MHRHKNKISQLRQIPGLQSYRIYLLKTSMLLDKCDCHFARRVQEYWYNSSQEKKNICHSIPANHSIGKRFSFLKAASQVACIPWQDDRSRPGSSASKSATCQSTRKASYNGPCHPGEESCSHRIATSNLLLKNSTSDIIFYFQILCI